MKADRIAKEHCIAQMSWKRLLLLTVAIGCVSVQHSHSQAEPSPVNAAASDFAQLSRYQASNITLLQRANSATVVFLGDSMIDYWGTKAGVWFPNQTWINRGIGGQTTSQILLRERADALSLHPKAIVIEGASNDMRLGFSNEQIRDNIVSMAELAHTHHISVFVAGMTPVCNCFRDLSGLRTVERIHKLNLLLEQACREAHWAYLDFNSPLADSSGHMRKELTTDGVHPNAAGYVLLAQVVNQKLKRFR
jgi:lysophospholipase L1-like esterase